MNLLVGVVANKYSDEWLSELLSELNVEWCGIFFRDEETAKTSSAKKFASLSMSHMKFKVADYSDFQEIMDKAYPVDEDILQKMAPYESQSFWMMERCVSREFNHRWHDYCKHIRFWNYVLDKYKIDLYLRSTTTHEVYDYIIYALCKIKGIKFICSEPMAFYNRLYIMEDIYESNAKLKDDYEHLKELYFDSEIEEVKLNSVTEEMYKFYTGQADRTPYYMKKKSMKTSNRAKQWLYENFVIAKAISDWRNRRDYDNNFVRWLRSVKQRFMLSLHGLVNICDFSIQNYMYFEKKFYETKIFREFDILAKWYEKNTTEADYREKYIYVAFHMQPEATSSPLGGVYVDQLLMVEMLSYWLPEGWYIYVKEHPSQYAQSVVGFECDSYRTFDFYKGLTKLPNVKLMSTKEDTYKLISNSKAVATLTGTAGLEAITSGIPFLMFGYGYMQYAPNVFPIRSNKDCQKALKAIKNMEAVDYSFELKLFFKALERYIVCGTTEGYLLDNEMERKESQKQLVNLYLNKLGLKQEV